MNALTAVLHFNVSVICSQLRCAVLNGVPLKETINGFKLHSILSNMTKRKKKKDRKKKNQAIQIFLGHKLSRQPEFPCCL